jgi:hypothetical protein
MDKYCYNYIMKKTERLMSMNRNLTGIIFLLDRSGSMAGLESDTIGGFIALVKKQCQPEGKQFSQ